MIVFENMMEAVKRMDKGMPAAVKRSLQQPLTEATIIDMNVEQQLAGRDSEGLPIDPPYAALTIAIKKIKGQPWDHVTLEDEGDFHAAVTIEWRNNDLFIFSKDEKNDKLTKKYGWQIFGLNDKNLAEIRLEHSLPYLLEYARDQLSKR
jgi:hypothetical protein